jgi:4-amino-4-deoxy-L-arabinose transferase-like glycosyltransferase
MFDMTQKAMTRLRHWLNSERFLWFAVGLALILRVGYAMREPLDERDASYYREIARQLADGRGFTGPDGQPAVFWSPVVPYILCGLYRVGGTDLAARQLWALIGLLCVCGAFTLVHENHSLPAANLAALGMALYPYNILMGGSTSTDMLNVLLTIVTLVFVFRWLRSGRLRDSAIAGLLLGVTVLNRPAAAAYGPLVVALIVFASRSVTVRRRIAGCALFSALAAAIFVPWSVHVSRIADTPSLVTTVGPGNLWQGLSPWVRDYLDGKMSAAEFLGRIDGETYPLWDQSVPWKIKNGAYLAAVKRYLREQPGDALHLMVYRTIKFWQIPGLSTVRTHSMWQKEMFAVVAVGLVSYVPIALLTMWCLFCTIRHRCWNQYGIYFLWIAWAFLTNVWFSSTITRYRFASAVDALMILIVAVFLTRRLWVAGGRGFTIHAILPPVDPDRFT